MARDRQHLLATGARVVTNWSLLVNLRADPYEHMPSSLNAGTINYTTLKAADALKKLQNLSSQGIPAN